MLRYLIVILFCLLPSLASADILPDPSWPPRPPRPRAEEVLGAHEPSTSDAAMFGCVLLCIVALVLDRGERRRKNGDSNLSDAE